MDEDTYTGWLTSTSLLKRSFATLGHVYLAGLIIYIPIVIIFMFFEL